MAAFPQNARGFVRALILHSIFLLGLLGGAGCTGYAPSGTAGVAVTEGDRALRAGEAEAAVAAYRRALDGAPRNPVALHGLARAYSARGDVEAALGIYAGLEFGAPSYFGRARSDCAIVLDIAADDRKRKGDLEGELRLLERLGEVARGSDGYDLEGRLRRARLAGGEHSLATRRDERAESLYRAVLRDHSQNLDAVVGLAAALQAQNRNDEAAALLSAAAQVHPGSPAIHRAIDRLSQLRYPTPPANASP